MRFFYYQVFRLIRFIKKRLLLVEGKYKTSFLFYIYNISLKGGFKTNGTPIIDISSGSQMKAGYDFRINNIMEGNPIGRQQPCFFILNHNSQLIIGNNVGLSSTAIVCHCKITIGDNVRIGGNTVIYDTDFHSLDSTNRQKSYEDQSLIKRKPVTIGNNVFIGAHSTVLKGVNIGDNSIVGACSVVTKDIPENQIWAGNPARFIRNIN